MIFVFLLLLYYWYFYSYSFKRIEKPDTPSTLKNTQYAFEFSSENSNHFQFIVNGEKAWEHTLQDKNFMFHRDKIVEIDPCHGVEDEKFILATGKPLYDHLMKIPQFYSNFKKSTPFTVQKGNVYYFKCLEGRIQNVNICPSGTTLVGEACQSINSCTNKPDGTLFPHQSLSSYIFCLSGKEKTRHCPENHIFHHNRCESKKSLNHFCKLNPNSTFLFNDVIRVECRNEKPHFIKCEPDTKFFNKENDCQSSLCDGLSDGTKLPLTTRNVHPFKFFPGYMTCLNNKIHETTECPQHWDEALTKDHNLTFLPMVFDGQQCSIPTFCENVISDDPDVIVPAHEFTKHVKNWQFSKLMDHSVGYVCENGSRVKRYLPPELRISKRFKAEPLCEDVQFPYRKLLIYEDETSYYDCDSKLKVSCPESEFFNGSACVPKPKNSFYFKNIPMFQFNSLNSESWIKAWDYSKNQQAVQCQDSEYINLYNICSHPDCVNYAFLSQIPDLAILLPHERAKCKFDKGELKKEQVDFDYYYWTQREVKDSTQEESCIPGQNIKTGNFIWDKTIYATCNMAQPFVFCPSTRSSGIILAKESRFACRPPDENYFIFSSNSKTWVPFESNEIKRILPANEMNNNSQVRIRKTKSLSWQTLPEDGINISETERLTLLTDEKSVKIEPRYRVTHPPDVAFHYSSDDTRKILTDPLNRGFLIRQGTFTNKLLNFPRYTPISHVNEFDKDLYI